MPTIHCTGYFWQFTSTILGRSRLWSGATDSTLYVESLAGAPYLALPRDCFFIGYKNLELDESDSDVSDAGTNAQEVWRTFMVDMTERLVMKSSGGHAFN